MHNISATIASLAGIIGVLICSIAGLARVGGFYYLAGFQSMTIFNIGMGLMVFACLLKLAVLDVRPRE